jgi:TolB protein
VVTGSVSDLADGRIDVRFRIWDVSRESEAVGTSRVALRVDARLAAHRSADEILERLTGTQGNFSRRVLRVLGLRSRFELVVSDHDGTDPQTALTSRAPIGLPVWSPDRLNVGYVSFEDGAARFWIQDVRSGTRQLSPVDAELQRICALEVAQISAEQSVFRDDWLTEDCPRRSSSECHSKMMSTFVNR